MEETAIVLFENLINRTSTEIEIPLNITANDLAFALNDAFVLEMNTDNIFNCYLVAENPIAFLRGNKTLKEYGLHNGSVILFQHR